MGNLEEIMYKIVSINSSPNCIKKAIGLSAENIGVISDFNASLILKAVFRSKLIKAIYG
jgi:hypothetical protein